MERMDESEMIRRAQAGDRPAFGALFDAYYPCVYRYLNERLGGAPEAEDLCQDVFLSVLGSIDQFPTDGNVAFDEWLLRVAHRLATEHQRSRAPQKRKALIAPMRVPQRLNPEAVALLPEHQQQIVTYRFHAGLSVRQTARTLGLEASIVQRIERAAMETWLRYAPMVSDG
jgi:RNA polymerase sigma-70 factor (ECF subfamily)